MVFDSDRSTSLIDPRHGVTLDRLPFGIVRGPLLISNKVPNSQRDLIDPTTKPRVSRLEGRCAIRQSCPKDKMPGGPTLRLVSFCPSSTAANRPVQTSLAERQGFEPWIPRGYNGFRDRRFQPLSHLSVFQSASREPGTALIYVWNAGCKAIPKALAVVASSALSPCVRLRAGSVHVRNDLYGRSVLEPAGFNIEAVYQINHPSTPLRATISLMGARLAKSPFVRLRAADLAPIGLEDRGDAGLSLTKPD